MSAARETVVNEALRVLRGLGFDTAAERDVLLFGSESLVCSALPMKIGVDNSHAVIYNLADKMSGLSSTLFSGARFSGGYLELELDDGGFARLFEQCAAQHPASGEPAAVLTVGCNAEYIHAQLLHTANTADASFYLPTAPKARRALWQCMMAVSPAGRSVALKTTAMALDEHRVNKTLCSRVAAVMAALVLDWF